MVVILVTIPFACGHFFKIGVREKVGLAYLRLDFRRGRFLRVDCKHVANFINLSLDNQCLSRNT